MWEGIVKGVLGFFGGPVVQGLVDSYKAKLAAGNTSERIAADLAGRELTVEQRERELATQQNIADEGRWWTAAPRAIVCWVFALYTVDQVFGLHMTQPLTEPISTWAGWLMAMWFGGRSLEKIAKIIRR
jgi:hypothetical protein